MSLFGQFSNSLCHLLVVAPRPRLPAVDHHTSTNCKNGFWTIRPVPLRSPRWVALPILRAICHRSRRRPSRPRPLLEGPGTLLLERTITSILTWPFAQKHVGYAIITTSLYTPNQFFLRSKRPHLFYPLIPVHYLHKTMWRKPWHLKPKAASWLLWYLLIGGQHCKVCFRWRYVTLTWRWGVRGLVLWAPI